MGIVSLHGLIIKLAAGQEYILDMGGLDIPIVKRHSPDRYGGKLVGILD